MPAKLHSWRCDYGLKNCILTGQWIEYCIIVTSTIPMPPSSWIFTSAHQTLAIQLIPVRLTLNFLMTSSSSSSSVNSGMLPRPPALSDRRSGKSSMLMARSSSFGTRCSAPLAHFSDGLRDDILSNALFADPAAVIQHKLLYWQYYWVWTKDVNQRSIF